MRAYDEAAKQLPPTNMRADDLFDVVRMVLKPSVREQLEANVGADGVGGGDGLSPFASTYVLSAEQLRAWRLHGCLMVRDALLEATVASLSSMADGLASLPTSGE